MRKDVIFIFVLLMIFLFGGVAFALKGDFNGDGEVTIIDAVSILRALSKPLNESFSIQGIVRDENQEPLENVMITIDGIEAQDLSDSQGSFLVKSENGFNHSVLVTASGDGYESFNGEISISGTTKDYQLDNDIILSESEPWGYLEIEVSPNPTSRKRNVNRSVKSCDGCEVLISGRVYKKRKKASNLYLLLIVDASGSTSEKYIDTQSVFDVEIEALKKLIDNLTEDNTYIGVIKFATNASLSLDFTDNLSEVKNTLEAMEPEPA